MTRLLPAQTSVGEEAVILKISGVGGKSFLLLYSRDRLACAGGSQNAL
jgi:hypothetical protein